MGQEGLQASSHTDEEDALMFDPVSATLIVAGLAGGYSAYQSSQQTKEVKKQTKANEAAANKLKADEDRNAAQSMMRNQRRIGTGSEPGLRDTILTGPIGVPNTGAGQAPKTLLGL